MKKYQILIYSLLCLGINTGKAQYTVLHNFNDTAGEYPFGSLSLSGGMLYGMTHSGGANNGGCIFSIDTNGNGYKDLFNFDSASGEYPLGSLTISGDILYGTTYLGRPNNDGCIFSIHTDGSGYKDIYDFNSIYNKSNSVEARGTLTLHGKILYGMTHNGGAYNEGCVFSLDTDGSGYLDLLDFTGGNGSGPSGSLTLSNGVLYGMTNQGGIGATGLIFSIDTNGNEFKNLYSFNIQSPNLGRGGPFGSLAISGGRLYGMTYQGGFPRNMGNVFSIDTNGTGYKDLFDFSGSNGEEPQGSLTISGGLLYGMTSYGTPNKGGNIFCIDTNGNGFRELYDFNGTDGQDPMGDLTLSGNMLYGMTNGGGIYNNAGVIFKIDTGARYVTSVNEVEARDGGIKVEPNPNNGRFILQFVGAQNFAPNTVEVYNVLGEQVYSNYQIIKSSNYQIDLSNQPNGVYFYRVISESGELVGDGKIVIEK